jgi:hypothetical protein
MKTFDEQLEAAFEAGVDYELDRHRRDLTRRPDSPDFKTWRANLAGLPEPEPVPQTEADLERSLAIHLP